jgi:hypothetical protein
MKKLIRIALFFIAMGVLAGAALAQTSSKQAAKDAKAAELKGKVEEGHFTFVAQFIQPMGGEQHYLTDEYDLRVKKDSVIAWLPYIGRVYLDAPIFPDDNGVKFSSTKFDYKIQPKKKDGWSITVNLNDVKRSSKLIFDISSTGSAYLTILSNTRDQVAYLGYIKEDKD